MLEGKEFEKNIGEYGTASVDLTPQGELKVSLEVHVNLVTEAKKLAAKTATPIDDAAIAWLEKLMQLVQPAPQPQAEAPQA